MDARKAMPAFDAFLVSRSLEVRATIIGGGPISLLRSLPNAWSTRLQTLYSGAALELRTLGRAELLGSKLFALVDRNIDLPDCVALRPTREELHDLLPWLSAQDSNEEWPGYVRIVLDKLAHELGYEL
jgi:hypothetical protein